MSGTTPTPPLEIFQQPAATAADLVNPQAAYAIILPPLAPSLLPRVRLATPQQIASMVGGGGSSNPSVISVPFSVPADTNQLLIGPVTVLSTGSITVPSGSVLKVI
jgi:hypothetical protein